MVAVMHLQLGVRPGGAQPWRPLNASRAQFTRRRLVRVRAESPIIEEVAGRRINAPVFNHTRWEYHQNAGRYARHLQSIFRSVTFRNLQGPLSALTLLSCVVVLHHTLVDMGELPNAFKGVEFTDVPFQLTSFALSLLLVFRTDASYARWSAALDSWGSLRNSTAHLVRKATAWVDDTASLQRIVRWVGAFPLCLMVELRYDQGTPELEAAIRRELREVLRPNEVEQVVASGPYYHQFCLSVLTALVEATGLGESREATMLDDLHGFNQAACECEKVLRFPIPLTYTRHTSRFMLIYLASLPLALVHQLDWAVVPVVVVISFLLLGIEDIGVQIEEPFSILPLPEICADLRATAQRAIAQRTMVRCLADPDSCRFDPDELETGVRRVRALSQGEVLGATSTSSWNALEELDSGDEREDGGGKGGGGGVADALSSKPTTAVDGSRASYIYGKGSGLVAALVDGGSSAGNGNGAVNGNGNGNGHGGHGSGPSALGGSRSPFNNHR